MNAATTDEIFRLGQAYGDLYTIRTALIDIERVLLSFDMKQEVAELTEMGRRLREIQMSLKPESR